MTSPACASCRSSSSATTTSGRTRRRRTSSSRPSTSPTARRRTGFDGIVVDGTDVLAVYREAKRAIEKARAGGGPTLVECVTQRMEGHAVHDDAFYVPREMLEEWAKADPIERFRNWLRENADFSDEEEDEIQANVKKLLNDALQRADESPLPDPSELTQGVYATPEDLDTPHHK
jgi:pyruvate dehydrogenase E1 component alpha subunit